MHLFWTFTDSFFLKTISLSFKDTPLQKRHCREVHIFVTVFKNGAFQTKTEDTFTHKHLLSDLKSASFNIRADTSDFMKDKHW
jgi:hypothetical protein